MRKISQPHDLFVKQSLKDVRIARDFLKGNLPLAIQQRIDFDTLTPTDKEFILPALRRIQSDVVYQCQIDEVAGYIYFLIEHQAKADELMAFRKIQYNIALMDDHLKQGNKTLPIIISLCIYNGVQSPYPYSTDIYDCFDHPSLAKELALQPFRLIDLTVLTDKEIEQHGLAALMALLLKHNRSKQIYNLFKKLQQSGQLQRILTHINDDNYVISVLQYTLNTGEDRQHQVDDIIDVFAKALPETKDTIMTFAQQLEQRGMQKGMQEGFEQQKLATARKMLQEGFADNVILRITGLMAFELEKIKTDL